MCEVELIVLLIKDESNSNVKKMAPPPIAVQYVQEMGTSLPKDPAPSLELARAP